ncbi:Ribosomal RNA small subunit methyltransferase G [compost metagenome]
MKGADPSEELLDSKKSLAELKGKLLASHHLKLPYEQSDRHIIVIGKNDRTPAKYPRKAGLPMKQPII